MLVQYGRLEALTLGNNATLPDIDQAGNTVGVGCDPQSFIWNGITFSRTSCSVITSS
jgi:hypothetical protein